MNASSSDPIGAIRAYHARSKHAPRRFAPGPRGLDWATQPVPFRRWNGSELLPLDLLPPTGGPAYAAALVEGGVPPASLDRASLSRFLFDSLALSAWKQAGGSQWPLRVNPSSGNLHPTEGHVLLPALSGLNETAGVFHYSPVDHGLERRTTIPVEAWARIEAEIGRDAFLFGFTSIHWREAWKYGERAYRYCQHDAGHAIAALAVAAAGLGWRVELIDSLATNEVGALLGASAPSGPEAEHPDCLLVVRPADSKRTPPDFPATLAPEFLALEWSGEANPLSSDHVEWPAIEVAATHARKPRTASPSEDGGYSGTPSPLGGAAPLLRTIVHQRRSGQNYDRRTGISSGDFLQMMESVVPRAGRVPFDAWPWRPRTHLALFLHRVEGFESGLYALVRGDDRLESVRAALDPTFRWEHPPDTPPELPLYLLRPGDYRPAAQDLSCNQEIAADGAFSLGMLVEFDDAITTHGAWFYPRLFWETGIVGQRLYLEAEAVGLRATGIGCYFDDGVHELLGIRDHRFQSLYHFTVGRAVEDLRIMTLPPYSHLRDKHRSAD